MQRPSWILWNMLLALVPVALGYALAYGYGTLTLKRKRVPGWVWLPLAVTWFAFLPNACYLFTEWRHYLFNQPYTGFREMAATSRDQLFAARTSLLFFAYSIVGILCFTLGIRPVEQILRRTRAPLVVLAVPFFFLVSLGVYMGLIARLNSWDIVHSPGHVWDVAVHAVVYTPLLKVVVIFALLLWLIYEATDIWVDGFVLRFRRSRKSRPTKD